MAEGMSLDMLDVTESTARLTVDGFLTAYRGNTLSNYRTDVARLQRWLDEQGVPLLEAKRVHVQLYRQHLEDCGLAPASVSRHLTAIAMLYRYAEEEEVIEKSPARYVKRPYVPDISTSEYLDREEIGRYLVAAEGDGVMSHATICLLLLNGLRVMEATGATIDKLGFDKGHRTLEIMGKGGRPAVVPLPPRTGRAVLQAVGERTGGPILLNRRGVQMSRHNASRITHRVARMAKVDKSIGPHALRHSFASAGFDAGVSTRDMQTGLRHADPKTSARYDRTRFNLDRHPAYIVAAFVAGGT